jgi:peptidyl-prolyl cis-trans isomerase A (cyclophilin A)
MRKPFVTDHRNAALSRISGALAIATLTIAPLSGATVVEFQTVLGNFEVNLFDQTTPATVTNFLDYVNNGAYTDSFFHRSEPGFVLQGGGFTYDGSLPFNDVPANPAVVNEPELSNVRGTIAMAKLGGDPNSATSQWFINLVDNVANLDGQNGGFTVFGVVMGNGMDVVDALAALPRFDFGGAFAALPLQNYTDTTVDPDADNLALVNAIVVTDTTVDTGSSLLPPVNTTINPPTTPAPTLAPSSGGGGGATGVASLIALGWLGLRRRRNN